MKLSISSAPARAAARVAVAARVFLALAVDAPSIHNGAWISAILGALLAAPWVICAQFLGRRRGGATRILRAALGGFVLLDAALVFGVVARSAGYLALDRAPSVELWLPAGLAVLWCASRGGDAVGYGGMLWTRVGLILLAGVALMQRRFLRPEWLRPLLGDGWRGIVDGAVRLAGPIVAAASALTLPEEGDARPAKALRTLAVGAGIAAAMLALRLMMTPYQVLDGGWLNRLDALLCNGRAPLYLQLPLIVLWFAGLLHLLACECFAASELLQALLPALSGRLCALLTVSAAIALSQARGLSGLYGALSTWGYAAVAALTALALILSDHNKGGTAACARD